MFLSYPDDADPFATSDGREQAIRFSLRFKNSDDAKERCCVLAEAISNTRGEENQDYFRRLIEMPRGSAIFETMLIVGDREFEYDSDENDRIRRYYLSMFLFALVSDEEFESIVQIADHLVAGGAEVAMRLLTELRRKRPDLRDSLENG